MPEVLPCQGLWGPPGGPADLSVLLGLSVVAALVAWTLRDRVRFPWWVPALSVALHLWMLGVGPAYSDDVWRYLWEGRVLLAGENPFAHPPDSLALEALRDATWERVAHKEVSTIYPPGALALFALVAGLGAGPLGWGLLSGACNLGVGLLLVRACRDRGVGVWAPTLYMLHPLPALESAGSGHLEPIALLLATAALTLRGPLAAFLASLGGLVKLLPAVLLVSLMRRPRQLLGALPALAVGALLALPVLDEHLLRGFGRYYEAWAFNASLFRLLEMVAGEHARSLGVGLGAAWCGWAAWTSRDPARLLLHVSGALVLLSPVVHPWYLLWPLVPALARGVWPWAVLASTGLLSYAVLASYDASTSTWSEPSWVIWLEYPPLALALGVYWISSRRRAARPSACPTAPAASPSARP